MTVRAWYVRCEDPRIPAAPMSLSDARKQARICDEKWPECAPHAVVQGRLYE